MSLRDCIEKAGDALSEGDRQFLLQELLDGSTDEQALDNLAEAINLEMSAIAAQVKGVTETSDYKEKSEVPAQPPQDYILTDDDKANIAKWKKQVPGFSRLLKWLTPDEQAAIKSKQSAQNLVDMLKELPSNAEMAAVAEAGRAKRGWYVNSQRAIEEIFGEDAPRFTALLAALSPRTSVESNTMNALRVWSAWTAAGRPQNTKAIMRILGENVEGDRGEDSVLGAWIPNSMRALTTQTPESVVLSGPKANSFMLNLRGYGNAVTNDAWMAAYAGVEQDLFGGKGKVLPGKGWGYLGMSILTRQAADRLSTLDDPWTPAEVQETVWSFAKTVFEKADAKGEDRPALKILQAGDVTHEEIGATVDFEQLFTKGPYRKILEGAGYGSELRQVDQSVKDRPPQELSGSIYKKSAHLNRAAKRLTELAKARAAAAVRTEVQIGLSVGQSADQPGAIPGLVGLTQEAEAGDVQARILMQDLAWDSLSYLMKGIKSVKMSRTRAQGLYGGMAEPSLGISLSFKEEDRVRTLAMLAKFADNFNQEQIHVRSTAPARKVVGHVFPNDGSFVTQVVRYTLEQPMARNEAEALMEQAGLGGVTITDDYIETYYAGDPSNEQQVKEFFQAAEAARKLLGSRSRGVVRERQRLWAYGDGDGATQGFEAIRGQFQAPPKDQASQSAIRVANRVAGIAIEPAEQAPRITEPQRQLQERIAQAYEEMPVNRLDDPIVRKAYTALAEELVEQFDAIPIRPEAWDGKGEPYTDSRGRIQSRLMRQDVLFNNHLYYYATEKDTFGPPDQDYSNHPLLRKSGRKDSNGRELLYNDLLRIVHDYYAHTMSPVGFGPLGEEAAWKNHMLMTKSPWARWALTSETRGQNSWVNFRPEVAERLRDRPFSEQKVGLLPPEFLQTGEPDLDSSIAELPGGDMVEPPAHYSQSVGTAYHGTGANELEGGRLQTKYVGGGEGTGANNFGWGLYFSSKAAMANQFREWIVEDRGPEEGEGGLYMVGIEPQMDELIDWDSTYDRQSEYVQKILTQMTGKAPAYFEAIDFRGGDLYNMISRDLGGDKAASLALLEAGIKGHRFTDPGARAYGAQNYVIYSDRDVQVIDRLLQSNTYYSVLERTIEGMPQEKGTRQQFLAYIKKFAKQEEIEWVGLEEFLAPQDEAQMELFDTNTITKQEVLSFVRAGGVQVNDYFVDDPEYGSYTLPGGENYTELLLTLPVNENQVKGGWGVISEFEDRILERFDNEAEAAAYAETLEEPATVERVSPTEGVAEMFDTNHFSEPNIIAHVRFDERYDWGEKVLFLQEIQSDWHQEARTLRMDEVERISRVEKISMQEAAKKVPDNYGYAATEQQRNAWRREQGELEVKMEKARLEFEELGGRRSHENELIRAGQPEVAKRQDDLKQELTDLSDQWNMLESQIRIGGGRVPNAPFKKTWPLLVMKRMIRYAAENGFDRIAWTTGQQQNDRYDLSKKVSRITYNPESKELMAYDLNDQPVVREDAEPEQLAKYLGAEMAQKLLAQPLESDVTLEPTGYLDNDPEFLALRPDQQARVEEVWIRDRETGVQQPTPMTRAAAQRIHPPKYRLVGEQMQIGGDGMVGFYDKILPSITNKYIKKWGSKVETFQVTEYQDLDEAREDALINMETTVKQDLIQESVEEADISWDITPQGYILVGEDVPENIPDEPAYRGPIDRNEHAMADQMVYWAHKVRVENMFSDSDVRQIAQDRLTEEGFDRAIDVIGDQPSFPITPEMRDSVLTGQAYFQDTPTNEDRGRFFPNVDGDRVIQLLNASDPSSFLHEAGHLFLDMQRVWVREFGITEDQKAMLKWLGVSDFSHVTIEHHEKWAETFEVYLREGKAPSLTLRRAFASFARWLKRIYTSLRDRRLTRAQIDPEIRKIFDRLLATQEEIELAKAAPEYTQLFKTQEQSGMTDTQWAQYTKRAKRVSETAEMTLDEKVMAEYKKQKSRQWKEQKAPIIEQQAQLIGQQPVYQVIKDARVMKDDEGNVIQDLRMDWHALKKATGEMPSGRWTQMAVGGGIDPKLYAEQFGFASVKDMVNQINDAPALQAAAEEAAEQIMIEKNGDILNDGSLEEEVREAMLNDDHAEMLMMELRAANKVSGWMAELGRPFASRVNRKYLKLEAERIIGEMSYKQIRPDKYYRQMVKAAKQAVTDSAEGNNPTQAKIQELANHYLYKEAVRVREKMQKNRRKVSRVQKQKYNPQVVHPDYITNIKRLAMAYDMRLKPNRQKEMLQGVLDFYRGQIAPKKGEDQEAAKLEELMNLELLDPNLIEAFNHSNDPDNAGQGLTNYTLKTFDELTAEELQGVVDMIDHLRHVGGNLMDLDQARNQALRDEGVAATLEKGGKDSKIQRGDQARFRDVRLVWGNIINSFPSIVNMTRKLDGFEDGGWWQTNVLIPINEAQARKFELQQEQFDQMEEFTRGMSTLGLRLDDAEAYQTEAGKEIYKHSEEIFMMAVYWGTESSRQAIMDGHELTERDVMRLMQRLTDDQLKMVNAVWALNEAQWPKLQQAAKAMLGVAPPKLKPTPFVVNGIQMTGGHMQLMYDSAGIQLKDEQQTGMNTGTTVPMRNASTHARVGSGGKKVLLLASNITRSLEEKTHYIAFAEVGRHLRSIVNNERIAAAIEQKHGPGFYDNFIHAIAGVTAAVRAQETVKGLARVSAYVRANATMMHLAYSIRNVTQQFPAAAIAMREVGTWQFTQAMGLLISQPRAMIQQIHIKSQFMKNRGQVVNREAKETLRRMMATTEGRRRWEKLKELAFVMQTRVDMVIAYPTWYAKYNQAMADHGNEKRAVLEADAAVGESVGSGSDIHLGRIMQANQNEFVKTLTVFGSWFNAYYQRLYKHSRGGESFANKNFLIEATIMPFIVANLTQMIIFDFPDEEETWPEYAADNTWMFMASTLPLIRDAVSLSQGFTPTTPLGNIMKSVMRLPAEIGDYLRGDQTGIKTASDIGKAAGTLLPLPGSGNVWRSLDYVDSYLQGNEGDIFNPAQMLTEGVDRNK